MALEDLLDQKLAPVARVSSTIYQTLAAPTMAARDDSRRNLELHIGAPLTLLACVSVICVSPGCALREIPAPNADRNLVARPATPAVVELSHVGLAPGVHAESVSVDGHKRTITLVVPEHLDGRKASAPLVIHLHGLAGRAALDVVRDWALPAFAALHPIFVVPHCTDGQWWKPEEGAFVLGLVDAAKKHWPVDPHRVVVMGYSNGGIGAWYFARLHPEHFSAAIPMASNDSIIGPTSIPVYAIHGERDEVFAIDGVQRKVTTMQAAGVNVTLRVLPRCRHVDVSACAYKAELRAAASWLEREVWSKQ